MKLNITGYKTKDIEELREIEKNIEVSCKLLPFEDEVRKALNTLLFDIKRELRKREKSKTVLVKFTAEWSGYTSNQKKLCAVEYRKISRDIFNKMPKSFVHNFNDNTNNLWKAKIVFRKDKKSYNTYGSQVDKFLSDIK